MGEMQVLTFVERFLGSVAALLEMLPSIGIKGCATKNTWGDAIYMVFSRVPDAGIVALLLSDLVQVGRAGRGWEGRRTSSRWGGRAEDGRGGGPRPGGVPLTLRL